MADNDQDPPPMPGLSGAAAVGQAGTFVPPSANLSGAAAVALAGNVTIQATSGLAVETTVIRAPFSEPGMAERLASDPEFYRRLAAHVASELRAYADSIDTQGQANAGHVIKGRVTEIADGFDEAATALTTQNGILTPEAAANAAAIVSKIRSAYSALCSDHPELLRVAKICLAGMALYQFGHTPEGWAGLIAYAVIEGVKLPDFIGRKKDDDDAPTKT